MRFDKLGQPRKGRGGWGFDEPLAWDEFRTAIRLRLMLPIGSVLRAAQRESNPSARGDWLPRCFCRRPCDETQRHRRLIDAYGLHLGSRVTAMQYTHRHNDYVKALAALINRAGFHASIEKHPFRDPSDLGDLEDDEAEHAPSRSGKVDLSARLDIVVRGFPVDVLRSIDRNLVEHLPPGMGSTSLLVDCTFTHPGPFLVEATELRNKLQDPQAIGDLAAEKKRKRYLAKTVAHRHALLPFHCNAFGRLHSLATKFVDMLARRVALKKKLEASSDPSAPARDHDTADIKRDELRKLAVCARRSAVRGLTDSVISVRPRFRPETLDELTNVAVPTNPSVFSPASVTLGATPAA